MTPADIAVIVVGAVLIGAELWFFLGPRPAPVRPAAPRDGIQEVRVTVKDGYDPDVIFVEAGRPVRLLFYREGTAEGCERLLLPDFGIEQDLPAFETTAVQFTPDAPGDYVFTCGRRALKGRVVAQVGRDGARANLGKGHGKHA